MEDLVTRVTQHYKPEKRGLIGELLRAGSPFCLLQIFLKESFSGDFTILYSDGTINRVITNDKILFHLTALSKSLQTGNHELGQCYGPVFSSPFVLSATCHGNSQGKLLYSFLDFCLASNAAGFNAVVEIGGGEDLGGENHDVAMRILSEHNVAMEVTLIDPLITETSRVIGKCRISGVKDTIDETYVSEVPVFCDIFNDANWNEVQESVRAPFKMLKRKFGYGGCSRAQPYADERREYVGVVDSQLAWFILGDTMSGFDNCVNCRLWKALIYQYHVDKDSILRGIVHLRIKPGGSVPGQSVAARIEREYDKLGADLKTVFSYPVYSSAGIRANNVMRRSYTNAEYELYEFLQSVVEGVDEICGSGVMPIRGINAGFFSGGVPFYRGTKISMGGGKMIIDEGTPWPPHYTEIETFSNELGCFKVIDVPITTVVVPVDKKTALPGTIKCGVHGTFYLTPGDIKRKDCSCDMVEWCVGVKKVDCTISQQKQDKSVMLNLFRVYSRCVSG